MHNLPFHPPLRAASVGAGSKPARYGVLMLLEMCIAPIFCLPLNCVRGGVKPPLPCNIQEQTEDMCDTNLGYHHNAVNLLQVRPAPAVREQERG